MKIDLTAALAQMAAERPQAMSEAERKARCGLLWKLFVHFGADKDQNSASRLRTYLGETDSIPWFHLRAAARLVMRTRVYPGAPPLAELIEAAREVAGMNREQYRAGVGYLPPPRDWPPAGHRHGSYEGDLEPLDDAARQLEAPAKAIGASQ